MLLGIEFGQWMQVKPFCSSIKISFPRALYQKKTESALSQAMTCCQTGDRPSNPDLVPWREYVSPQMHCLDRNFLRLIQISKIFFHKFGLKTSDLRGKETRIETCIILMGQVPSLPSHCTSLAFSIYNIPEVNLWWLLITPCLGGIKHWRRFLIHPCFCIHSRCVFTWQSAFVWGNHFSFR